MTEKLDDIIFFTIEKSIKSYRQFAQRNIDRNGWNITIDQWLVLKGLKEQPGIAQQELSVIIGKDVASVTRMIDLLVKKKYIRRTFHSTDRRRFQLSLTPEGEKVLETLQPVIESNRRQALKGITPENIRQLGSLLNKIMANVTAPPSI